MSSTISTNRPIASAKPTEGLHALAYPALFIAFALFFIFPLGLHGLWVPDETRYAQAAQELLHSGNWVVPHFLGLRYFEKPIGGYWLIAIGQAVFGDNLFGARIASALTTGATVLLVYLLAQRIWNDPRKTWTACLLYMTFGLAAGQAGYSNIDPQLALWTTLSVASAWFGLEGRNARERGFGWVMLGVGCALGFMTKGFLAWLLPMIVVLPYAVLKGRWRVLLKGGTLAVLIAILLSLPWILAVNHRESDFWNFFFWNENIRRFSGNDAQHAAPFWFFLPILFAGTLPWPLLVIPSLKRAWAERSDRNIVFLALWFAMPFLFFSLSKGKLPTYILPCFTPFALLMANTLVDKLRQGDLRALRANGLFNVALGSLSLLSLIGLELVNPVFEGHTLRLVGAAVVCLVWALCGFLQWKRAAKHWYAPALAIWVLIAILPNSMPQVIVDNKMPDQFIAQHLEQLQGTKSLLSNSLGTASALAWRLNRTDVTLLDVEGELRYGLGYADAQDRRVLSKDVAEWLKKQMKLGSVGIVLKESDKADKEQLPSWLPDGAKLFRENNLLIVITP
ncbi:lipid IV(A) 4-amino-4-deoxy-L-arabinosyltransferase [Pseudomonas sp. 10B1]|uniref:lipid IV(A) 4-amino-4-deoxy-L-arabinosyltransferase n=1 Tax=unclassified Pseudomonas TaxID=196821 RepID=UPI002AB4F872|nr:MULTISPECIES: lipid IV(A) 4-amino-4-deoxy-L-arabinosyltransferase [unclassified Pseudomonas]MDY7560668.1 lipid IV(A) 4-amino-4-deoxy-L-arabinosyltransferase [Pseudomonas sp. AB6]MEA9993424.1 lipid IV(A) 4-amino-4-deoxy-L-arabinosyltransferase [Pseudomonas sp. AA4]MEB0089047.1 lipid IV(A) 4-amino-4-deoxy-L-arabinosyltransferase [Pseudomonas sp. RTI1]MEB0124089.1 lipid IV(A) 4-amino-4-deoxy-L-arabinosyltransferase [Pseudomonas sp. CCC1.2]MEB0152548.1 lipid IV(A) 4-amino-4-deoxy-L-arabinosyltr